MKQFSWVKTLILNIVTFGLYGLYAWYVMSKNNNELAEKYGEKKIMNFIVAMLLGCVTCGIFLLIWYFQFHKQQVAIAKASGAAVTPTESPIVLLIITFVPIYSFYVLCTNYNNGVAAAEAK